MFEGQHNFSVDKKGRVSIPARFRDLLKENGLNQLTVTHGLDNCLYAYTSERWATMKKTLLSLPKSSRKARFLIRHLIGAACVCSINEQGRINIPANLLEDAGITKEVVIMGVETHIEIWDKEKFYSYSNDSVVYLDDLEGLDIY